MQLLLLYPHFDPIAIHLLPAFTIHWYSWIASILGTSSTTLGPFGIRWYALAYITGLVLGWRFCLRLARKPPITMRPIDIDDFISWATIGVVLGGRLGYVLFYKPGDYLADPAEIIKVWHGGMSFHGGCAGVIIAIIVFARQRGIPMLALGDIVACAVPIGLFFGRLANFVNGELWGRRTDVPWAMIFPNAPDSLPRHPSQLYQAGLEGLVLFVVINTLERSGARWRPGTLCGTFLIGYAVARTFGELFREPDEQLGFVIFGATMGQLLSLPMLGVGIWLVMRAKRIESPLRDETA